jgi:WD40 repeat protein
MEYLHSTDEHILVLYGAKGMGKTSMLSAAAHKIKAEFEIAVKEAGKNKPNREALQKLVQALEGREAMVWEMFQEMDKDGSAALDKEELKEGLDMLGVSMTDAELDSVMIAFDQDGGGDVDYVEFYEVLEKFTAAQAAGALQPLEGYTIVLRYTGSTVASSSSLQMMNSMCEQIAASYGHNAALHVVQPSVYAIPPESASVQHNGASTRFWEHLRMATALKPLLIFIDGLENLRLPDGNIDIDWIPANLPTHVRLVATLGAEGTDRILSALQEALPEKAIVDIGTIDSGDATNMVQKWLKDDRRSLKAEQQRRLQNVATDPSPLYVSMAYNVTKLWRSYMLPSETTIQPTLTSVISQFFDNIDAAHPDGLLAAALQFLVGTRVGISELELDDLLALDDSLLLSAAPWIGTDPDSLAVSRLPTYFVSRLLADLSPMLLKITSGGGEVVYIWAHEQFRTAASYRANYPTRSSQLCEMIAGYFGQHSVSVHTATIADTLRNRHDRCLDPQPLWRGVVPNYRAVSELPVACERASLFPSLFGLLTSLNFIEAKFSAGLGLDLITDYAMLDLADLTVEQTDTLAQFREFVLRNRTLLHHRPAQTLQQAFLEHRDGHIFQAAQQMAMQAASGDPEFIRFAVAPADCAALIHRPGVLELLNPPAMPTNVLTISATPDIEAGWIDGAPFVANEEDAVAGISACCFGPDGNYLLVASYDQIIRLYSIPSGRVLHSLTNFSAPITLMATAVPADSSRCLIAAGHSYTINLWDITSNAQEISDREVQLHHTHPLTAIQICRGAELLAAASVKGMIKIWSTTSGSCLKSVSLPSSEAAVCCLAWTPDSSYLLVGSEAQQLALLHLIWDTSAIEIARIKFTAVPGMEGSVIKHAEFSADSHSAMTCSADGQVTLWSCRSGTTVGGEQRMKMKLTKKLGQQRGGVIGCQYSRSSRELIVAAGDGSVCRWDVSSGNLLLNCTSSVPCPLTVALCRNRPLVASVMRNGRVHVWLLPSSEDTPIQQAAVTPIGRMGAIKCIDFSCDGQQIVIGSDETFDLELRSVEGFRLIRTMSGHLGAINAVAFDSSGDWVYSASEDRSMRVWSQRHHAMVLMGQHADGLVQCRTAKQSSKSISVSRDGVLKLWSIVQNSSLALVKTIHLNGGSPTSANISDDASRISYCSDSNKLNIWHVKGSDSSTVLDSNIDLTCSAFSRDLDYLAGGAVDQSVVVWDLSARSQIAYLEAHEADIFQVQFAALPHIVASLSCDGALFLWDCQQKLRLRSYCFNASLDQPTAFSVDLFNALMAVGDEAGYVFVMRVHSADVHRNQIKAIQSATDVSMVNNWEW